MGIVDMMGIVGMVGMMGIVGMPNRGSEASWVILTPGVSILARGHQWLHTRTSMVSFWTIWLLQVPQRMLLGRWGIGVEWGRVLSQYANINAMQWFIRTATKRVLVGNILIYDYMPCERPVWIQSVSMGVDKIPVRVRKILLGGL